jgi:2-polyprenyl-6-methoxyphenol hydroxylase-like FAD-dependent oxidoreductase
MIQKAIIIGGGIGGLCTAIALQQVGIEVTIYEQAAVLGRVGAGITLWPNAIKALGKLGLADSVKAAGAVAAQAQIRRWDGATLVASSAQVLGSGPPGSGTPGYGAPTIAIHRADLHQVLLEALPDGVVQLGAACTGFTQNESSVMAQFGDGRSHTADLLIGADGINSIVRQQLWPQRQPRYAGYTAYRGVVTMDSSALFASESWGSGQRFGIVPIGAQQVYWFATANMKAGEGAKQTAVEGKHQLLQRFRGWHKPIETLISQTPADEILQNDIYDLRPSRPWYQNRVVLLGDAIHATTPNMGQGACMAIESAVVLAQQLQQSPDWQTALQNYEAIRSPRTAWITKQSWQIGSMGQWQNPAAVRLRDWVMGIMPPSVAGRQVATAVNYEI